MSRKDAIILLQILGIQAQDEFHIGQTCRKDFFRLFFCIGAVEAVFQGELMKTGGRYNCLQ